jgi:LPXTG-site transpeptidase (sortase) family protein
MYNDSNSEIHRLLKLNQQSEHVNGAPEHLPIAEHIESDEDLHEPHPQEIHIEHVEFEPVGHGETVALENPLRDSLKNIKIAPNWLKSVLIYLGIFVGAFVFFFVILNFPAISAQVQGWFAQPQSQQLSGQDLTAYYKWISGYYYAVSDPKMLDPNNDIDHDGLTNYDEFIMHTNPIVADSDGDGYPDGVEVLNGYNPWGAGKMTADQKKLASQLDMNLIAERIGDATAQKAGVVIPANSYDLSRPGTLSIPKLNLQVSLLWPTDPSQFDAELTQGVIHYPGTALPGQLGIMYVSGHSSDYIWKHDPMASIFTRLNYLKPGDDVYIQIYDKDGKVQNFRYQVTGSKTYKPDDQAQFIDNSTNKLNLSTCWPIGTSQDRLVVSAVQVPL